MSFDSLGLSAELCRAVAEKGYSNATPIQSEAIPYILEGRDILAGAQTGTGKTAAFTLPILQRLSEDPRGLRRKQARVLVVVPTRELAAQVMENVEAYSKHLRIRAAVVFGGVSIHPQIKKLRDGVDILIATPGRLLDHVSQRTLDLSATEVLVLDEADRMLDMGFIRDIRKIIALLPEDRQNLMFSATFAGEIKELAESLLDDPARVQVTKEVTADKIRQAIQLVDRSIKRELLSYLIGHNNWRQVLVFTRTKHGANRLSKQLIKDGIRAAAIHGDKSQGARTRALADFKDGKIAVLVATDIAARGLDIDQLPHVVNFELPHVPEDYVHRIGRTGRAGREGEALSLVCEEEFKQLRDIEKLIGIQIPRKETEGFEPSPELVRKSKAQTNPPKPHKPRRRRGGPNQGGNGGSGNRNRSQQQSRGNNRSRSQRRRASA